LGKAEKPSAAIERIYVALGTKYVLYLYSNIDTVQILSQEPSKFSQSI